MKNSMVKWFLLLSGFLVSSVAFAADHAAGGSSVGLIAIGSGIAIGLGAFGAATSQGRAVSAALEGIARNPNAKDAMFVNFILGLVFMEFQALLSFAIAFLLMGNM